jgi:hypothetical protein
MYIYNNSNKIANLILIIIIIIIQIKSEKKIK